MMDMSFPNKVPKLSEFRTPKGDSEDSEDGFRSISEDSESISEDINRTIQTSPT